MAYNKTFVKSMEEYKSPTSQLEQLALHFAYIYRSNILPCQIIAELFKMIAKKVQFSFILKNMHNYKLNGGKIEKIVSNHILYLFFILFLKAGSNFSNPSSNIFDFVYGRILYLCTVVISEVQS